MYLRHGLNRLTDEQTVPEFYVSFGRQQNKVNI